MTMTKLAAIGARTSSTDGEGDSIEAQIAECRAWAEANGYKVVTETREDGVSGALPVEQRPELRRGLETLSTGRADAYVWRAPDRLGRRADTGQVIESFRIFGDGLLFVRVPAIENRFASIMMRSSFTGYSEGERAMIYDRTSGGRNRSAREGAGVGIGTLPRWLRFHRHARKKTTGEIAAACEDCPLPEGFRLVEAEAQSVRSLILGGYVEQQRQGAPPWKLIRLRKETSAGGLRVLLPLRLDSVESEYREQQKAARRQERNGKIKDVLACPTIEEAETVARDLGFITQRVPSPITWDELYTARQKALAVPNARRGRPPSKRLPLQGRVICSVHGFQYTPVRTGGSVKYPGYRYATCTARMGYMAERHGRCQMPRLPWERDTRRGRSLIGLVREALRNALESPGAIDQAAQDYLAAMRARIDQLQAGEGDLEDQLKRERRKYTHMLELKADPDVDLEILERDLAAAKRQITDLKERLRRDDAEELRKLERRYRTAKRLLETEPFVSPYSVETDSELHQTAEKIGLVVYVEADRLRLEGAIPLGEVLLEPAQSTKANVLSRQSPSRS